MANPVMSNPNMSGSDHTCWMMGNILELGKVWR
jgi:hypothetical protein